MSPTAHGIWKPAGGAKKKVSPEMLNCTLQSASAKGEVNTKVRGDWSEKRRLLGSTLPPPDLIPHLSSLDVERVLVCGLQTDTCVLAAGFALFDAGLHPTLLSWLTVGSSLDRSGELGARLWRHHFGSVLASPTEI